MTSNPHGLRCLIVDYGGVLTNPVQESFGAWAEQDGLEMAELKDVLGAMLGESADSNPVHGLERGELSAVEFERQLAAALRRKDGAKVPPEGLLRRVFAGMRPSDGMTSVVRRAKERGIMTGLLSNSWGLDYDRNGWDELFDTLVISGEVGLRKPEPAIYELAAERLGVKPAECVFVDDLAVNVRGAAAAGMIGVHHTSLESTVAELETLFGVPLAGPSE
jgi:epoxide hydrolase-like predicted phosphatase